MYQSKSERFIKIKDDLLQTGRLNRVRRSLQTDWICIYNTAYGEYLTSSAYHDGPNYYVYTKESRGLSLDDHYKWKFILEDGKYIIKNKGDGKYLLAARFRTRDSSRRWVFTYDTIFVDSWWYIKKKDGSTYTIQSVYNENEYLYASKFRGNDNLRYSRSVFTWIEGGEVIQSYWKLFTKC
jgi:hypothetical protein